MYLLLAVIILLLLFAASYGGRGTWVPLGSTTLSVLLIAACAFVANAPSAGPFFTNLAAQLPGSLSGGLEDLAYTAERTAAAVEARQRIATAEPAPEPPPAAATGAEEGRPGGDWLDFSWFKADWLNPLAWFGEDAGPAPEVDLELSQSGKTPAAEQAPPAPEAPAAEAPMPTVRSMMPGHDAGPAPEKDQDARQRAEPGPSYRIVTPPEPAAAPPTETPPDTPPENFENAAGAPVKWLPDAPHPDGVDMVLLSGTNVSDAPLEDIEATLKPDLGGGTAAIESLALRLRIEGQDAQGPAASVPPGTRFHLQAAGLSEADAERLKGAIVSFAYSQGGRRRTSIMYLDQAALGGQAVGGQAVGGQTGSIP